MTASDCLQDFTVEFGSVWLFTSIRNLPLNLRLSYEFHNEKEERPAVKSKTKSLRIQAV